MRFQQGIPVEAALAISIPARVFEFPRTRIKADQAVVPLQNREPGLGRRQAKLNRAKRYVCQRITSPSVHGQATASDRFSVHSEKLSTLLNRYSHGCTARRVMYCVT